MTFVQSPLDQQLTVLYPISLLYGVTFFKEETAGMQFLVWTLLGEDSFYAHIEGIHLKPQATWKGLDEGGWEQR